MIELKTWKHDDCTLGRLSCDGVHCFTLELPWLDNLKDVSCIPAGWYEYTAYDSPKHGDVLLLLDVKGRSMIEIHAGNYTRQIEGCILVGDSIKYLDADQIPDVTNSRATLSKLLAVAGNSGIIKIERV